LANLYVSDNVTPVLPQTSNNFPVNFTIPTNTTHNVDVYADLGNIAFNTTTQVALLLTAVGALLTPQLLALLQSVLWLVKL